jgi:1,4-dihydroxy-2-naphthoate octaprenyltransferase
MNEQQRVLTTKIIGVINPLNIFGILIFYFLGVGIHRYLGGSIDWLLFFTGLTCVILFHCSAMLINAYFDGPEEKPLLKSSNKSEWMSFNVFVHNAELTAGLTTLAVGFVMAYLLVLWKAISPAGSMVLVFGLVAEFLYAVPPIKLTDQGMGEIIQTIIFSSITPALGFLLQNGEMHRLVALITFPLVPMVLSVLICMELKHYLQDMLTHKQTLLQRIQWKNGMKLHLIFVFCTFFLAGVAIIFGLPLSIGWPYLVALPLSGISIFEISRIQTGVKPRWNILLFGSFGSLGCTLYLINFALWTG